MKTLYVFLALSALVVTSSLSIAGFAFIERFDATNQYKKTAAQSQLNQNKAIHSVLCLAQSLTTDEDAKTFYNRANDLIKQPHCKVKIVRPQ